VAAALRAALLSLTFAAISSCSAPPSAGVQPTAASARNSRLPDSLLALMTLEESRLHIPLLFDHDVIHGWRTVFPVPLAEAASA
jgi:beta-glucosidase-like glycosyl hydrolase